MASFIQLYWFQYTIFSDISTSETGIVRRGRISSNMVVDTDRFPAQTQGPMLSGDQFMEVVTFLEDDFRAKQAERLGVSIDAFNQRYVVSARIDNIFPCEILDHLG